MYSSTVISSTFLTLATLISTINAQLAQQTITSPKSGDTIEQGNPTTIKWTPLPQYDRIGLSVCRSTSNPQQPDCNSIGGGITNSGSYTWTPDEDDGTGSSFYIIMTYGNGGFVGQSAVFAVTDGEDEDDDDGGRSSTTRTRSPTSSATSRASQTTIDTTVTETVGSDISSGSADSNSGSGDPSGAAIGGGVAGAIIVILLGVIAFLLIKRRRSKKLAAGYMDQLRKQKENEEKDIEAGGATFGAGIAAGRGKAVDGGRKPTGGYSEPPKGVFEASNTAIAELPAVQQEPVEMQSFGGQQFVMELDGREITRPGTSTVHPDVEGVGKKPTGVLEYEKEFTSRGNSIDGTTVDGDGERPKTSGTMGTIEALKEGGEQSRLSEDIRSHEQPRTSREGEVRNSTGPPQIRSSIPRLPDFNFDSSKF